MSSSNVCLQKEVLDWLTVGIRPGSSCVLDSILIVQSHCFSLSHLCCLLGQQDGHQPLHSSSMTPSPRKAGILFLMVWEKFPETGLTGLAWISGLCLQGELRTQGQWCLTIQDEPKMHQKATLESTSPKLELTRGQWELL